MTVSELWDDYMNTKSREARNGLVKEYIGFVGYLVNKLPDPPSGIEKEDLIQFGVFGLIEAIERFDPKQGYKFESYASRRINGSIVDQIRYFGKTNGGLSRSLVVKQKKIKEVISILNLKLKREPSTNEIIEALGWTKEEYNKTLSLIGNGGHVSLDKMIGIDDNMSTIEVIENKNSTVPEEELLKEEYKERLAEALDKLEEKQKIIMTLIYYKEWTLKEVGKYLNLSESRISQIHSEAILRLQSKMMSEE